MAGEKLNLVASTMKFVAKQLTGTTHFVYFVNMTNVIIGRCGSTRNCLL